MPNWCNNQLTVSGDEELVRHFFLTGSSYENGEFVPLLFGNFVPMPKFEEDPSSGAIPRWYDWKVNHWGTKWDLDSHTDYTIEDTFLSYSFASAWSPPVEWLNTVATYYPDLEFQLEYSEPGMGFIGVASGSEGEIYEETRTMTLEDHHDQFMHDGYPVAGCEHCEPEDFIEYHQNEGHDESPDEDCPICEHLAGEHEQRNMWCPMCDVAAGA
jgi:hypothetical protein